MEEKYLSVTEYAAAVGVSSQAVYKSIKNGRLAGYVVEHGKRKYILATALDNQPTETNQPCNQNQPNATDIQPESCNNATNHQPETNQPTNQIQPDFATYLLAEIEELKAEKAGYLATIQEQSKQIAELAERCAELANRALTATTNQQTLAAMDRTAEPPQIAETTEHSRSFWQRLFKK